MLIVSFLLGIYIWIVIFCHIRRFYVYIYIFNMNYIQAYCVFVFIYDETQDVHFPIYPHICPGQYSATALTNAVDGGIMRYACVDFMSVLVFN